MEDFVSIRIREHEKNSGLGQRADGCMVMVDRILVSQASYTARVAAFVCCADQPNHC
jgi:hypothetical protein